MKSELCDISFSGCRGSFSRTCYFILYINFITNSSWGIDFWWTFDGKHWQQQKSLMTLI